MTLEEHSFVVFVYDKHGRPIPDAAIEVILEGEPIAKASTIGDNTSPIRVHLSGDVSAVGLRAIVGDHTKEVTVGVDVGTYTFEFPEVEMPSPPSPSSVPPWFAKAGVVFAVLTLLFFMTLVFLSIFGRLPPPEARFLVVMTLSLAAAFSFTFLGANASAKGNIPLPFAREYPIRFAVAGGVAVFVIVLVLASLLYPEVH